jgi:TPR repeat protein
VANGLVVGRSGLQHLADLGDSVSPEVIVFMKMLLSYVWSANMWCRQWSVRAEVAFACIVVSVVGGCASASRQQDEPPPHDPAVSETPSTASPRSSGGGAVTAYSVEDMIKHAREFESGEVLPKDQEYALKLYRAAATQGSAEAKCRLGTMLTGGRGVPADARKARALWDESLVAGFSDAKYWLGTRLCTGSDGLEIDCNRGWSLVMEAAGGDDLEAIFFVGDSFEKGRCISQDRAAARKWFLRGAAIGDPRCCRVAAQMAANGDGGLVDKVQAYQLNVACTQSIFMPRHELRLEDLKTYWMGAELEAARAELFGIGTVRNEAAGTERLKHLVGLDDPSAMTLLGDCFLAGKGVPKDGARAYVMYVLAVRMNDTTTVRARMREIGGGLSQQDLDVATYQLTKLLSHEDMLKIFGKRKK